MRALCWHGKKDIRCDTVPDPKIEAPRDAIVKVTSCAICGSDLHLYDGYHRLVDELLRLRIEFGSNRRTVPLQRTAANSRLGTRNFAQ